MRKIVLTCVAAAALAVPAVAAAEPTSDDRRNAAQECRDERGTTAATREAFAIKYGTNANRRNAFGKCVSSRARDEERETEAAGRSASQQCREERGETAMSRAAFGQRYGTNRNRRNAFGKCVSGRAAELERAADEKDDEAREKRKTAARQCDDERGETSTSRAAFAQKYGTNANRRNAFGKCVSQQQRLADQPAPSS